MNQYPIPGDQHKLIIVALPASWQLLPLPLTVKIVKWLVNVFKGLF